MSPVEGNQPVEPAEEVNALPLQVEEVHKDVREAKEMRELNTVTVQAEVPGRLFEEIDRLVRAGWFRDIDTLVGEALRRFLESRRAELIEEFIRQDVEWGLHGRE